MDTKIYFYTSVVVRNGKKIKVIITKLVPKKGLKLEAMN